MNDVQQRKVKGNLVNMAEFKDWKEKRQKVVQIRQGKAVNTFVSPVFDGRKKTCWKCGNPLSETEKICPYCHRFVGGSFDGTNTD